MLRVGIVQHSAAGDNSGHEGACHVDEEGRSDASDQEQSTEDRGPGAGGPAAGNGALRAFLGVEGGVEHVIEDHAATVKPDGRCEKRCHRGHVHGGHSTTQRKGSTCDREAC